MITRQATMPDALHGSHRRTRRRAFPEMMDASVPREEWPALIRPFYCKDFEGKKGRPPVRLETILRMYLLQVWHSLADEATEDEIYENAAMAWFLGVNIASSRVPDAATLLHFRHLLEKHGLCGAMFRHLASCLRRRAS